MPVTNYYSVNGAILGQSIDGVRTTYGQDALGSVVATFGSTGALQNTYRFSPFGSSAIKTGVASDPAFLWNGANGYQAIGGAYATHYVRARHYGSTSGWTTVDPRWPSMQPYCYAFANPVTLSDPSGLGDETQAPPTIQEILKDYPCNTLGCWNKAVFDFCNNVARNPYLGGQAQCDAVAAWYFQASGKGSIPAFPAWKNPNVPAEPVWYWGPVLGPFAPPSEIVPFHPAPIPIADAGAGDSPDCVAFSSNEVCIGETAKEELNVSACQEKCCGYIPAHCRQTKDSCEYTCAVSFVTSALIDFTMHKIPGTEGL